MNYYKRNMDRIKVRDIRLYDAVCAYSLHNELIQIEDVAARDGTLISKVSLNGRVQYLNSPYDPWVEADRFVAQYKVRVVDYSVMIMFGLGNGIIPQRMVYALPSNVQYIFYEPSVDMFVHMLQAYDLTDLFDNNRVMVLVRDLNYNFIEEKLSAVIGSNNYRIAFFDAVPKYHTLFPDEYELLKDRYCYVVNWIRINIDTCRYFAKQVAHNEIYNLRYILNGNVEEDLEEVLPKHSVQISILQTR